MTTYDKYILPHLSEEIKNYVETKDYPINMLRDYLRYITNNLIKVENHITDADIDLITDELNLMAESLDNMYGLVGDLEGYKGYQLPDTGGKYVRHLTYVLIRLDLNIDLIQGIESKVKFIGSMELFAGGINKCCQLLGFDHVGWVLTDEEDIRLLRVSLIKNH